MASVAHPVPDQPEQIGFLLLPEFPLYALVPALEALRIANQYAARRLFRVSLLSLDSAPVPAGNGMTLTSDAATETIRLQTPIAHMRRTPRPASCRRCWSSPATTRPSI